MVRNFTITNSRPFLPGRAWRNNTGPREVNLTATAIKIIQGDSTAISTEAP
jgi:hypothetical protein